MEEVGIKLPEKLKLVDFDNNWQDFEDAAYKIFVWDFVVSKPIFNGQALRLKTDPYRDGKECTFYHMTSEGKDENNRTPCEQRYERVGWAKPVIEECRKWRLKIWPQERNGKNRLCIWVELQGEPDYIVILDVRKNYTLLWTTFVLEYNNQKRKKQKEYEAYLNARAAQLN